MLNPASQAENMDAVPSSPAADFAKISHKKRKRRISTPVGEESSLEHGASNHGDVIMLPDTGRKRSRRDKTAVSVMSIDDSAIPNRMCTGDGERSRVLPAAPATGDASLQAGAELTNPNTTKEAKTGKQKSRLVDAGELPSPRHCIRHHFIY
jgi:hypothetical protein